MKKEYNRLERYFPRVKKETEVCLLQNNFDNLQEYLLSLVVYMVSYKYLLSGLTDSFCATLLYHKP